MNQNSDDNILLYFPHFSFCVLSQSVIFIELFGFSKVVSDTTVLVWKSFSNGKVFGMLDRKTTSIKSSLRPESGSSQRHFWKCVNSAFNDICFKPTTALHNVISVIIKVSVPCFKVSHSIPVLFYSICWPWQAAQNILSVLTGSALESS